MNRVLETNPSTGRPCIVIEADRISPALPPAEYLRLLHRWCDLVLPSHGRFTPPDGHNFDCPRLRVER